jgi:hypothetical protein
MSGTTELLLGQGCLPGANILHLPGSIWRWALGNKKVGCNIVVTAATCAPIPCNDSVDIEHIPGASVPIPTPTYIVRTRLETYNPNHASIFATTSPSRTHQWGTPHLTPMINKSQHGHIQSLHWPPLPNTLQPTTSQHPSNPKPGQAAPAHRNLSTPWNCICHGTTISSFHHATTKHPYLVISATIGLCDPAGTAGEQIESDGWLSCKATQGKAHLTRSCDTNSHKTGRARPLSRVISLYRPTLLGVGRFQGEKQASARVSRQWEYLPRVIVLQSSYDKKDSEGAFVTLVVATTRRRTCD